MPAARRLLVCASLALLLCAAPSTGLPADVVKQSIARGLKALRTLQTQPAGVKQHPIGAVALQGLTLLECDVPSSDPAIQKAARELRQASIELTHTYSLALAILFFDRLADPADTYLIQSLAVRLRTGQTYADGWSYYTPRPSAEQVRRLTTWLKQRTPSGTTLPSELQEQLKQLRQQANDSGVGDNSNTQFAVLALWAARRHGVPVDDAMSRVNARFRRTQDVAGGWPYVPSKGGEGPTASMTCAGLLALAMSHGVAVEAARRLDPQAPRLPVEPAKDPSIRAGLAALGSALHSAGTRKTGGLLLTKGFYFLWSLERVGVAYSLTTLGSEDWYSWGCDILVARQRADGSWQGEEGPEVDTCFALLFLRRANLTRDLSNTLRGVTDPGPVTLKVVGSEGVPDKALPMIEDAPLPASLDPAAAELCRALLKAPPERQQQLIDDLKNNKGVIHTDALAVAIPRLRGAVQDKARDALAERLTRMTAATLRGKLREDDLEVRVAAVRACATKDDRQHVPDLIGLLEDREPRVVRSAHRALTLMTRQDFGPPADATATQRARAAAAWTAWWNKQPRP